MFAMPESDPNAWPEPPLVTSILSWLHNPHGNPSRARLRGTVERKFVLITGVSFGIGEATAHRFAAAGATVLFVARSKTDLEQLAVSLRSEGRTAAAFPTDLTDPEQVDALGRVPAQPAVLPGG
jgi:hypothetical protein